MVKTAIETGGAVMTDILMLQPDILKTILICTTASLSAFSAFVTCKLYKQIKETNLMTALSIPEPSLAKIPPPNEEIQSEIQKPISLKWFLEGATRTGQIRHENQDDFSIFHEGNTACAIVCDGAGGHKGGGEASQSATEIMQASLQTDIRQGLLPKECLLRAIKTARDQFKSAELEGITTAILTIFEDDYIHYATLGDGALVAVYPDGMISQIQTPHHLLGQPSNIIAAYIGQDCEVAPRIGSVRIADLDFS